MTAVAKATLVTLAALSLAACGGGDSGKCGALSPDGCWENERAAADRQLEREKLAAEAEARREEAKAKAEQAEADRAERQAQRDAETRKAEAEAAARRAEAQSNADRLTAQQRATQSETSEAAETARRNRLATYWAIADWGPWNTAIVDLIPTATEVADTMRVRGQPIFVSGAPDLDRSAVWNGRFIGHEINPAVALALSDPLIQFRYKLQTKTMDAGISYLRNGTRVEVDKWHGLNAARSASVDRQGLKYQWHAIEGHTSPPIEQSFVIGEARTSNIIGTFRTELGVPTSTPGDE